MTAKERKTAFEPFAKPMKKVLGDRTASSAIVGVRGPHEERLWPRGIIGVNTVAVPWSMRSWIWWMTSMGAQHKP